MNPDFTSQFTDHSTGRKTLFWFRVYCILLSIVYILLAGLGVFLLVAQTQARRSDAMEMLIIGIIYLVLGAVFFAVFAVGALMPPRRWSWIYGLVLICIGMTSICCLPATVPLIIYWIKPETKSLFGR